MDKELLITAVGVMAIVMAYLTSVTFIPIPDTGLDHSKTIVPFLLGSGLSGLFGYYWGSSKKDKKEGE